MSDSTTAPVIAAATLLLCREGDTGLEVLMVKRHHKIDFASGALVFPGGKLCADDQDEHWQSTRDANGTPDDGMLPFYVAACRESFEESGILYAYGNDGKLVDGARS